MYFLSLIFLHLIKPLLSIYIQLFILENMKKSIEFLFHLLYIFILLEIFILEIIHLLRIVVKLTFHMQGPNIKSKLA